MWKFLVLTIVMFLTQSLAGFTAVSQALPQITQNIVIPDEQILSFSDLTQPVHNSLIPGSIHLVSMTSYLLHMYYFRHYNAENNSICLSFISQN